jgi:capsular exopolysaccharide synthesis family protein
MALALDGGIADAIRQHGAETYPNECCGALIGRDGQVTGTFALPNTTEEGPRRRFLVRPDDYRQAEKQAREVSGEGKSFIAGNLSVILSLGTNEKKILIVEADLRKPKLNLLFGQNADGIGLSTYLAKKNTINEIILQTLYTNLYFIPAGVIPPNPTELLENGRFELFIEEVRTQFDYVEIDNAPISLVPDGLMTSKYADSCIFIIRLNFSKKKELKEINKVVAVHKLKKSVLVINDTPRNKFGYGSKYWKNGYGNYLKLVKSA